MRTYDEAYAAALPEPAFSNGTQGEIWMAGWCERCANDTPELVDRGKGCPLIMVALMGRTPSEWMAQPNESPDQYHCAEFRDDDDPGQSGDLPDPSPEIDGQLPLFDADPYRGPRIYAPAPGVVAVA